MRNKLKSFLSWLKTQLTDNKTRIIFVIVLTIFISPIIFGNIAFLITHKKYFLAITTSYLAFWLGPFTPFWGLVVGLTLIIRRFLNKNMR